MDSTLSRTRIRRAQRKIESLRHRNFWNAQHAHLDRSAFASAANGDDSSLLIQRLAEELGELKIYHNAVRVRLNASESWLWPGIPCADVWASGVALRERVRDYLAHTPQAMPLDLCAVLFPESCTSHSPLCTIVDDVVQLTGAERTCNHMVPRRR